MAFVDYLANDYIRAGLIMLFVMVILRPLLFFMEKVVLMLTSKTETELDDILVKRAYKPVASLIILIGLFISIQELTLSDKAHLILQHLIHSAFAIVIAYTIYAFFDVVLVHTIKKHAAENGSGTRRSLISLVLSILRVVFFVIGLLYIFTVWGLEVGPFVAGLGIAGLAVALALQPTLANVFAGMGMILDKTIKEGDLVYLDDKTKGTIHKIGMRSTKIISFDNEYIIMPNSKLADSKIQNVALPDETARAVITFGVAYGSNIEQVKKLILKEVSSIPHVLKSPAPSIRFTEMKDSALEFKVYYHVDSYLNRFPTIDEANTRIYNTLNREGIEIPFPQLTVHLPTVNGPVKSVKKTKKI